MVKAISILGCTGSIGRQSIAVAEHLDMPVVALTANRQVELTERQARRLKPKFVALYDENAACRLALGNYCSMCTGSAEGLPEETVEARGINRSKLHVDFMMGSDQLTVTARCRDSKEVVLMRRGEWTDEF